MSHSESTSKLVRLSTWPTLGLLTPTMSKGKPPSIIHQSDSDIDDDPFSHFLSPVLDDEDPFEDDEFSAGINSFEDEVETRRTNFRTRIGEKWDSLMKQRARPRTPPDEDQLPDLENDDADAIKSPQGSPSDLATFEAELDGWEADRARRTFGFPLERPRLKTSRTLSGKRHSWIEPSPDLWNIDEADEADTIRPTRRGRSKLRHT